MDVYKQIFVSGRVQGVFFRDSTRQLAARLNLSGGVRNLADGRVEVQVTGDETMVQELIKWLKDGELEGVLDFPFSIKIDDGKWKLNPRGGRHVGEHDENV